jgi:hypothetical protein
VLIDPSVVQPSNPLDLKYTQQIHTKISHNKILRILRRIVDPSHTTIRGYSWPHASACPASLDVLGRLWYRWHQYCKLSPAINFWCIDMWSSYPHLGVLGTSMSWIQSQLSRDPPTSNLPQHYPIRWNGGKPPSQHSTIRKDYIDGRNEDAHKQPYFKASLRTSAPI